MVKYLETWKKARCYYLGILILIVIFIFATPRSVDAGTEPVNQELESGNDTVIEIQDQRNFNKIMLDNSVSSVRDPDTYAARVKIPTHRVYIYMFRSGSTTKVNVYAKYVSTIYSANMLHISSLKILTKTQKTQYKSFGTIRKTFPAGTSRYIYLGNAKIPKTVKKAYVRGTGIRVYTLKKGWLSTTNATGIGNIQ